MPIGEVTETLGLNSLDLGRFEVVLLRLLAAAGLGAFLGYRVWRRFLPRTLPPSREIAQAQMLIAIAGALMVIVIGQSTARAFGLVGLGGFIRFRSGIRDTRDAAGMFVMIGVGMACGLGAVPMAVVATLFVSAIMAVFDAGRRGRMKMTRLSLHVLEPRVAWQRIQLAFPGARVLELPANEEGTLLMETALGESLDAGGVLQLMEEKQVPGVRGVTIEEGKGG